MTMPLVSLLMMLKNEAANIHDVLVAVRPYIDRFAIFIDSETSDDTKAIVRATLDGVPGILVDKVWRGYKDTRNDLLAADNTPLLTGSVGEGVAPVELPPAEFQLFLSGDEYLRDGQKLRDHLESCRAGSEKKIAMPDGREVAASAVDCHFLWLTIDGSANKQPRVLRTGSAWRYDDFDCGVHEVPVHPDPEAPMVLVEGAHIEFIASDPERRLEAIEHVHIPLLREALARNPQNTRAMMLLAQSHEALMPYYEPEEKKEFAKESMELLLGRLAIATGNSSERSHCALQFLDFAQAAGIYSDQKLYETTDALFQVDPRPELALMAALCAMRTQKVPLPKLYELFRRAAEAAAVVGQRKDSVPVSTSCIWQAHYYCAVMARQIARKTPEFAEIAREHISAGLAMGGSWEVFKGLTADPVESTPENG